MNLIKKLMPVKFNRLQKIFPVEYLFFNEKYIPIKFGVISRYIPIKYKSFPSSKNIK